MNPKRYINRRLVAAKIKRLSAFTLVEIMIVVAIIGVLAAAVIPSMVKARKQSQGRRIINDVRQLDAAINQWALEKNKSDGATINTTEAVSYLKKSWPRTDLLGNAYRIRTVGTNQVAISGRTKTVWLVSGSIGVRTDWLLAQASAS